MRLRWVDSLRATAVLLVILYHAILVDPAHPPHPLVSAVSAAFTTLRMPILMFLSGLLLSRSLSKPVGTYLRGKLTRIAWPFVVWTSLYFVLDSLGGHAPRESLESQIFANPLYPTWYVGYLFVYYLLALALPARTRAGAILLCVGLSWLLTDVGWWGRFWLLLAFFLVGDLAQRHARVLSRCSRNQVVLVVAVGVVTPLLVASALGADVAYSAAYAGPVLAGIVAVVPLFRWVASTGPGGVLSFYGRHTMVMYLVHWPVVVASARALDVLDLPWPTVSLLLRFAVTVLAAVGAVWVVERVPALRLLFELTPRRRTARGLSELSPSPVPPRGSHRGCPRRRRPARARSAGPRPAS